ncbi:undecaprenyl-diphosphate phosphatase [Pseudemcibacter aquimaris]|uniref:undecaprenyl-diphosphate phosphatase n=1 Tax=Pseudemcibacter aquimaris TaxID=2857064 RepID=UPI00201216F5|nr:undecaprenyl-diphosphate phosphatase [Pseudemcibacter aquimaris]MCC3860385.1 undecaprenyl-diphosphate phosphatase [Pseudemcibacter aquimaris]WDU57711.1 undecaprenyl-diphosphate phosphatase [Pseudemcibacter aquimaris]
MSLLQIIVLAIVQGITEFLPISSSGHLILVPELTNWPDQGLMMDVGVHVGTLGAVILYFRNEVGRLFKSFFKLITFNKEYDALDRNLMWMIILATIPIVVFGGAASALGLTDVWRTIEIIGWTSIIFGVALYFADTKCADKLNLDKICFGHALIIGFAQVLAIIPGTSRSGITMTAARAIGFNRTDAARFSMLLSIPTILAAAILQIKDLIEVGNVTIGTDLLLGAALSFVAALLAIAGLLKWLESSSMTPFVIYRVLLGIGLLAFVYG